VDGQDAEGFYPLFWKRAAGNYFDEEGHQVLVSLAQALRDAVDEYPQNRWYGNREEHKNLVYRPFLRGEGVNLPSARGGKSEEELQAMGSLP